MLSIFRLVFMLLSDAFIMSWRSIRAPDNNTKTSVQDGQHLPTLVYLSI